MRKWQIAALAVAIAVVTMSLFASVQTVGSSSGTTFTPMHMQDNHHHHNKNGMITLSGNVPYVMTSSQFANDLFQVGPAPGDINLTLTLYLGFHNITLLQWYVNQVNNPYSYMYHHYLSPSSFREYFYPSQYTINSIEQYYSEQGFKVWNYNYAPTVIVLAGNISTIDNVFNLTEYLYQFSPGGITSNVASGIEFISNIANPSVPAKFSDIFHVYGLSYSTEVLLNSGNQSQTKSNLVIQGQTPGPQGNSYILTPPNLASYYQVNSLFSAGLQGQGTSIGILGVGESVSMSAVSAFWNGYGIPNPNVVFVNLTANGMNPYGQGFESDLDVEWAGAMAPQATIYDVMQPFNLTGIGNNAVNLELYYMLNVLDPNVISGSWAELQFHHDAGFAKIYTYMGLQAAAEGITVFLGSSDSHDINYLTVMASQYIVSVGGVYPVMNDTGQIVAEYAWYQPIYQWYGGPVGSGGGNSFFFSKPAYQTCSAIKVPVQYYNRGQPDFAMPASNLITNYNGHWYIGGGTSYATPISAGIFASIESGTQCHGSHFGRLGWIQPMLYNLGYWSHAYYKVNYLQPGPWLNGTGYLGPGWNEYTGIGSLQTYNLYGDISQYDAPHFHHYHHF